MLSQEELEAKYHIVYVGKQRFYRQSLEKKDFSLECTTPFSLEIDDQSFISSSWKQLLIDVCTYLLKKYPYNKDALLKYKPSWTGSYQFSTCPNKNWCEIGYGVYLLSNHTALHAFWLLREVLIIFDIDLKKSDFIIHRCPSAEPFECRRFFENKTKETFKYYYVNLLRKSEEKAEQVLRNIDTLNRFLGFMSRSYDNFFLIDNNGTFSNYKMKFLDYLRYDKKINEKNVEIADKYLTILGTFYKDTR